MKLFKPEELTKLSYFELLAYIGLPWLHPGGYWATKKLVKNCGISSDSSVLEIGAGIGRTVLNIAEEYGCRAIGADINPLMIARSKEKLKDRAKICDFIRCDSNDLPLKNECFDVIIAQSVLIYLDLKRALSEIKRILKYRGRLGVIEYTWLEKPSEKLANKISRLTGIKFETFTFNEWRSLFENFGFKELSAGIFIEESDHSFDIFITEGFESFNILLRYLKIDPSQRLKLKEISRLFINSNEIGYGIYCYTKAPLSA
ncbi:MAG: class I SAM-dependent methyltransferase [Euryarchaeota archaeon]|nr:class I SAM-dependent methyltransferase [Euryarchaeota archaeon]